MNKINIVSFQNKKKIKKEEKSPCSKAGFIS
jgi:hypothetical protein